MRLEYVVHEHCITPHITHTHTRMHAQELEHKLRQIKHDSHFVEVARSKVVQYDELEREHKMVCLENKALRWEHTPFLLGGEYTLLV